MLDIRWLEDLLALAELRNFRKAAELRHIAQSGLSRRIQSLEHWAAVPLVDREATPLELTDHGKALAAVAADVVRRLNQQRVAFAEIRRTGARNVAIVAPRSLSVSFFPRWLPFIERALGELELTVLSEPLPQGCLALKEGKAHLLVCQLDRDGAIEKRLRLYFIVKSELSLVIGHDKLIPLSVADRDGKPRYGIGEGNPVECVGYVPECTLGWALDGLLERRPEIRLRHRHQRAPSYGVHAMAVAGMGMAWLPESTTVDQRATGTLVRAGDPSLDIPLDVVAVRRDTKLPPAIEGLWRFLAVEQVPVAGRASLEQPLRLVNG